MRLLVLVSFLFLAACASKNLVNPAQRITQNPPANVDVSSEVIGEYSDVYNLLLQINLESKDGQWVRVDKAELDLSNVDNMPYNIIVGKDLVAWADAKAEEKKIRLQNEDLSANGLAAAGGAIAIIGAITNSKELMGAGLLTSAGGLGYDLKNKVGRNKSEAQQGQWVPETHLYSPFSIPSMSVVKRWILINVPSGRIAREGILTLTTVEGDTFKYHISLVNK